MKNGSSSPTLRRVGRLVVRRRGQQVLVGAVAARPVRQPVRRRPPASPARAPASAHSPATTIARGAPSATMRDSSSTPRRQFSGWTTRPARPGRVVDLLELGRVLGEHRHAVAALQRQAVGPRPAQAVGEAADALVELAPRWCGARSVVSTTASPRGVSAAHFSGIRPMLTMVSRGGRGRRSRSAMNQPSSRWTNWSRYQPLDSTWIAPFSIESSVRLLTAIAASAVSFSNQSVRQVVPALVGLGGHRVRVQRADRRPALERADQRRRRARSQAHPGVLGEAATR